MPFAQTNNRDRFLSRDFGLREFAPVKYASLSQVNCTGQALNGAKVRLAHYRRFIYEKGGLIKGMEDRFKGLDLTDVDRFRYRTRYFTDSGIIGTKEFVSRVYQGGKGHFSSRHEKRPKPI